jgi:hypothetical protein
MERSNAFGEVTGIDHWDACKRTGTNLNSLRSFLNNLEALPEDLRNFIVNSSDEALRDQLLRPIEWDTENKAQPFVEDSIQIDPLMVNCMGHIGPDDYLPIRFERIYSLASNEQKWVHDVHPMTSKERMLLERVGPIYLDG